MKWVLDCIAPVGRPGAEHIPRHWHSALNLAAFNLKFKFKFKKFKVKSRMPYSQARESQRPSESAQLETANSSGFAADQVRLACESKSKSLALIPSATDGGVEHIIRVDS